MKEFVTMATTAVLVNGSPTYEFTLARGLRQWNLLSPFLFVLVAEGFYVMMAAMVTNNIFIRWVGAEAYMFLTVSLQMSH